MIIIIQIKNDFYYIYLSAEAFGSNNRHTVIIYFNLFSPFYWAEFVAQRERAQQDFKVPYTSPTPPSHTKDSHSTGITLLLYE